MSTIDPKNDDLWQSIARSIYAGVISYSIVLAIAFLRDFARSRSGATSANRPYSASILRLYQRFLSRYRDTHVFYYVEALRLTANLTVCALYIVGTYLRDVPVYTSIIYRIFAAVSLIDMLLFLLVAESAISIVFRPVVVIDAVSFPSLILASGEDDFLNFAYLRAISAFCSYARLERRMFVQFFSHNRLVVKLCFKTLTLLYTLAASIQMLEIPGDLLSVNFRETWSEYGDWNFMNSAYFIIVTLSTVGYGDLSPQTVQGRIYALLIIIVGIIVFTSVVTELVNQANRERGGGYLVKNSRTRHVIVTGNPTLYDLVHFVSEFYSDSRRSNETAKVVVLVENAPWSDTEWFQYIARNQFLQSRLQFLSGSATNSSDLQRARISSADAVFVLTSPSTGDDPSLQDTRTVMVILAIRNARNDIPIYAQTLLEDSNLQTHVALNTVAKGSQGSTERSGATHARYRGIYPAVINNELKNVSRNYQRLARRYVESVLTNNLSKHEKIDDSPSSEGSLAEALHLSQHVCLQEIQIALITGNIKANGVGTLLSNMYLDVQATKPSKEDPGWLAEYQMGANTHLLFSMVPDELNNVLLKDIAGDLYEGGIIVVATTDPVTMRPRPVLNTASERLAGGDLVMVLSYFDSDYVGAAFMLVAMRFLRGELKHPPDEDGGPTDSFTVGPSGEAVRVRTTGLSIPTIVSPQQPRTYKWMPQSLSYMTFSVSADDLEALARADAQETGGALLTDSNKELVDLTSDEYIPSRLKGHVIIAMEGTAPLNSLPLLLKNLWHREKRKYSRGVRRARVVVIHPSISDDFRKRFDAFETVSLFFVEGSPASRATWRKAKLSTARAVATIADITQSANTMDARTIFTLLTLDVSTANDQDLFICSELVDEKSLEYLREPIHARRRGAKLGEPNERSTSVYGEPSSLQFNRMGRDGSGTDFATSPSTTGDSGGVPSPHTPQSPISPSTQAGPSSPTENVEGEEKRNQRTITFAEDVETVGAGERVTESPSVSGGTSGTAGTSPGPGGHVPLARLSSKKHARKAGWLVSGKAPSITAVDAKGLAVNLGPDAGGVDALEAGADPNNRPGAARARRSTLFSRSRYASGELLVQSSAITLMAREYIEPGFVQFFTNVLGTNVASPGMKIRLVRIPKSMFDPERGHTCPKGRPLIRYIDIFMTLVDFGVTPLGIYRSGSAPVLIPHRRRMKRGPALTNVLGPLLEQAARRSNFHELSAKSVTSGGKVGHLVKSMADTLRDVNPAKKRENMAREEIHGNMHNLFEMDDDDDDDDDDETFSPADGDEKEICSEPAASSRLHPAAPPEGEDVGGGEVEEPQTTQGEEADAAGPSPRKESAIRKWGTFSMFRGRRSEVDLDAASDVSQSNNLMEKTVHIPGSGKYVERQVAGNLLPYVYTFPDPNTWCAETDGIYILCDSATVLPRTWAETGNDEAPPTQSEVPTLKRLDAS